MRSIYKFDLLKANNSIIEGPIVKLLSAQVQHGSIMIWAEVDTDLPNSKWSIFPIGTGWPLDPPAGKQCVLDTHKFLDTIQLADGSLVCHIYYAKIVEKVRERERSEVNEDNNKTSMVKFEKSKSPNFTVKNTVINQEVLEKFLR